MTLTKFIEKYTGKKIDFDGYYGEQCVDLYRQYCKEVLCFKQGPLVSGAYEIFTKFRTNEFTAIANTPTGLPKPGDIIIWGIGAGKYGHAAIFIEGNLQSFKSFDQNWPIGSACHEQFHTYKNVIGWLTPWLTPI